jgi:tRNA-specific 2-thiouridylase
VNPQKRQRVIVGMSGGVDSSATAALLLEQGYDVVGITLKLWPQDCVSRAEDKCCGPQAVSDARAVCNKLGVPYYLIDEAAEFQSKVIQYFADEYKAGRTPNPCVMCNNWLKFGKLVEYADHIGAELVATGHYARLKQMPGERVPALVRGRDAGKDQSYVLFGIDRQVLPRLLFPVGDYEKHEIRALARDVGLRVADKKDSQEICFVPEGDYAAFVDRQEGAVDLSGQIVTVEGQVVGQHAGLQHFTIGQRKGLGIALGGGPRYVVRLERDARRVVIGTREQLGRSRFTVDRVNWLAEPAARLECDVQIRYQSRPAPGCVTMLDGGRAEVELTEPRDGIAPGQAAVWYDGDRVLGGGWIE